MRLIKDFLKRIHRFFYHQCPKCGSLRIRKIDTSTFVEKTFTRLVHILKCECGHEFSEDDIIDHLPIGLSTD